jgi:glycosyltransferase involved in cell wall biosynthesis
MAVGAVGKAAARPSTTILMGTLGRPGWDEHVSTLIDQTVPADEFLVVIDRTTDASERAAMQEKWPGITFVFNDDNIGLTRSLNIGLGRAKGDIILRADDDDAYFPTRVERQLRAFAETGADLISAWGEGIADGGKPYLISAPTDDAGIKAALLKRNVILHPALAFRRSAVEAIGGYNESFLYAQDYALYLAAVRAGLTFAVIPEPLVRRFYHADNIGVSRRYRQMMYSCAARCLHCAHLGDRAMFVRTLAHYAALAATPPWARVARRKAFTLIGRGR